MSSGDLPASDLYSEISESEEAKDSISIDISFRIIRQFSLQLYDNPRRAIEELVCNSYDANATECHISTPESVEDSLQVLDNGHSMDMEGLEWLWKVAASRKEEQLGEDRTKDGRQQIGKFGVGKLASFALGSRLTYVATKEGTTRVVSVHQERLKDDDGKSEETFDVYEFPADEAKDRIGQYFETVPDPWEEGWTSWTLALVSHIPEEKTGNSLRPWHLKNMIQTAIPTSTDFTAFLNQEEIDSREPHGEKEYEVDVTEEELIESIEEQILSYWAQRKDVDRSEVDSELYEIETTTFPDPKNTDEELAGIKVPNLGNVAGKGRLFDRPLTTSKRKERGFKDNGFRVRVRGKLVNKDDELFGLDALSFSTWAQFLGEFEMPGLDDVIRVQRDDVKDTVKVDIAQLVLKKTFDDVRSYHRNMGEDDDGGVVTSGSSSSGKTIQRSFSERLQDRSRYYAYDAVGGLVDESGGEEINLDSIDIKTKPLNPTDRAVQFEVDENLIVINEEHPLFDTLRMQDNFTEHIEDAFKEILAARLLIHGYLRQNGADKQALAASRQIFDSVLRSAAGKLGADELDYQLGELDDASTVGGTRFENAIEDIFQNIGLSAVQEGGPDTHDGVIKIPQVGENFRISIEAKGSKGIIANGDVGLDDVNRHRSEEDCHHSVLIAREFKTDGIGEKKSALIRNMDPDINDEWVEQISFFTTEAMEVFLRLHNKQPFSYSETIDILTNDCLPEGVTDYVIQVWESKPDDQLTRDILEAAHEFLETDPTNPPSIGALTADPRLRGIEREKITSRLESLSVLTDSVSMDDDEVFIDASTDAILQEIDEIETNVNEVLDRDPALED